MKQTPHVAMLPSPGMGHIIPMVELAKKLIFHNQNDLSITLIIPDSGLHPVQQKPFLESLSSEPKIDLIYLPMPNLDDFAGFDIATIINTVPRSLPFINNVLESLVEKTNLVALVVDLFGSAVFEMAREVHKIHPYLFFPSNATFLSFFLHLPEIDSSFSGAYKDLPDGGLVRIPGCIALRAEDLPEPCNDRDSIPYKWSLKEGKRYKMAEGIIVNTFQEMENGAINALRQNGNFPPIYPVGPLVRETDYGRDHDESSPTMKWLEQQPNRSVLFVSFGSLGSLSQSQLHELALGLEMSGKRFIWVIRDKNCGLPDGFVERTDGRGLVLWNWAPQARILGHASTGGFVTHCGWNSVQESVVNGVPMIVWPLQSDQKMIARLLTGEDGLKIAVRVFDVIREEGVVVGKYEIAFGVNKLMEGEEGKAVRKRLKAVMEAAKAATGDSGASTKSLTDLVCLWKDRST